MGGDTSLGLGDFGAEDASSRRLRRRLFRCQPGVYAGDRVKDLEFPDALNMIIKSALVYV